MSENIHILRDAFPLLRRIMEYTKLPMQSRMYDLSASAKFPDARLQSPLLILSKIVAEILFVYLKNEKKTSLN